MKLPTIPPGLVGKRKKPPALATNQIAGFGGFRPLASLEKIKWVIAHELLIIYITLKIIIEPKIN